MLVFALVFSDGQTPLHHSSGNFELEACRLLLQSGADVNARDK
jgi:ankyrin repeat protein